MEEVEGLSPSSSTIFDFNLCFFSLANFTYTKSMFKFFVRKRLEHYAKKYLKTHDVKLIAVVGSVGKTTTKLAIATVLGEKYRIRTHEGNYNTPFAVPTSILGVEYPDNVHSIRAWLNVFKAARIRIDSPKDTDAIVQELGTDRPGDIRQFCNYLRPHIAVVTAVSPEHMENFKDLDEVAREELWIAKYSDLTIVNRDDVAAEYAKYAETTSISTYGSTEKAEYRIYAEMSNSLQGGVMGIFHAPDWEPASVNLQLIGDHSLRAAVAAAAVGARMGLSLQEITIGLARIRPVAGRMNVLRGVNHSTLIDDSYNSSPLALRAALTTLYAIPSQQRIAILGSMNELGVFAQKAHEEAGKLCDPKFLDWVVTIGGDAANYLAPAARTNGCQVKTFLNPYEAGGFVHGIIKQGAVVLIKGSQNGVFAEEATKVLLHDASDEAQLVRQSPVWVARKKAVFDNMPTGKDD